MPLGYPRVMRTFNARCRELGQAGIADKAGVSVQTVCDIANGRRAPWGKVLEWLGYSIETRYRRRPIEADRAGVTPRTDSATAAASAPQGTSE